MIARAALAAVMLVVAACVLAGCASESIHPGAAQANAPVPTVSASPEGAPIGDALALVSAQLDSSAFATMTLVSTATTTATAPDTWLQVTLDPAGSQDNDILRNTWEAFLAEGAIAKLAAPPGSETPAAGIAGIAVDTPESDGTIDHATYRASRLDTLDRTFDAPSDAQAVANARSAITAAGMTPVDIRVLHPLASYSALYVVAQVAADSDVEGFASLLDALDGDGKTDAHEGTYLELRNASGQTLVADGIDKLTGAGTFWEKPGLDVSTGIDHG